MVRRLKGEVALELPDKLRCVVHFPRPPADRWPDKRSIADDDGDDDSDGYENGGGSKNVAKDVRQKLSQEHRVGLAKVKDVIEWVSGILSRGMDDPAEAGPTDASAEVPDFCGRPERLL
eukprot:scaffold260501_cov40-Prasinocladus_malaysianus.AAC.1